MATLLTAAQREEHFGLLTEVVLDNFSMTWRLVEVLIQYRAANLPPPKATVLLRGKGTPVTIPGTNCGFFVNPVVNTAIIDSRRSLEFFGLGCDHKAHRLRPLPTRRNPDDLRIEDFGLAAVSREQLLAATASVLSTPAEPVLVQVHAWSNKQLAHFTTTQNIVTLQAIRDASKVIIEAYMVLLFDALGHLRPVLQPSP